MILKEAVDDMESLGTALFLLTCLYSNSVDGFRSVSRSYSGGQFPLYGHNNPSGQRLVC